MSNLLFQHIREITIGKMNAKSYLNDIISVETENEETHFTGSIVFVHEGTYSTSEAK
jgi:hypothetical protein